MTGGESTSIWAGIPPEKALVRGAEGQSRMGYPWLFPSMQLLQLQLQQLQEVGPWPIRTPWPAATNTEELGRRPVRFVVSGCSGGHT